MPTARPRRLRPRPSTAILAIVAGTVTAGVHVPPTRAAALRAADALHVAPHHGGGAALVTRDGRRVLLRRANVSALVDYRGARPTTPVGTADGRQLRALGLDAVRIGVSWSRIAPRPGVIDRAYLAAALRSARRFSRTGAYVLLDMHADRYAADLGQLGQEGDGAPPWAVDTAGIGCDRATTERLGVHPYYVSACATAAAARFWANAPIAGRGLHEWYADAVGAATRTFRRLGPAFAGVELYNEPSNPGTPELAGRFVTAGLWPLYRTLIRRIRSAGYAGPLWLDPQSMGESGTHAELQARFGGDRQLVFAIHPYVDVFDRPPDAGTPGRIRSLYGALARQARRQGVAYGMTETPGVAGGAGGVWDAYGRVQLDAQDADLVPGFAWLWKQPASVAYGWELLRPDGGLTGARNGPKLGRPRLISSARRVLRARASSRSLRVDSDGAAGLVTVWSGTGVGRAARQGMAPRLTIDGRPARGRSRPRVVVRTVRAGGDAYGGRELRVLVPRGRHVLRLRP